MSIKIGRKDRTGKEIVVGDIFEYENVYIIEEHPEEKGHYVVTEYENQVEYGVEEEPYYELISRYELDDFEFENDKVIGNIEDKDSIKKFLHNDFTEEELGMPERETPDLILHDNKLYEMFENNLNKDNTNMRGDL